jgi:hypothetical protein
MSVRPEQQSGSMSDDANAVAVEITWPWDSAP